MNLSVYVFMRSFSLIFTNMIFLPLLLAASVAASTVEHSAFLNDIKTKIWKGDDPAEQALAVDGFFSTSGHTNNWAVLVWC
jgi:hypothetical protein